MTDVPLKNLQYYLIHGLKHERKIRMETEFEKWGLSKTDVLWLTHPNKNEIPYQQIYKIADFDNPIVGNPLTPGQIACTYKHYLCLKDIVDNNFEYGIIFEDNIFFTGNIPNRINEYITQLHTKYPDWDILFDSNFSIYDEGEITTDCLVYPKSNYQTVSSHGGSKCAQFYLLTNKCANKMVDNFFPFNVTSDFHMNNLFRKLDIKSFWAETPLSNIFPHISTTIKDKSRKMNMIF